MISEVPWPFFIDIFDVAVAIELWQQGLFDRPHEVTLSRHSRPGLILTELMAGKAEADEFLSEFAYSTEIVECLSRQRFLSAAPDDFWAYVENGTFTGEFWALEDGTVFQNLEPMASLGGFVGHVVLFQSGVKTIFDHMVALAAEAHDLTKGVASRIRIIDGGSQRSFGHGWSLWAAEAARIAGRQPYPLDKFQAVVGVRDVEGGREDRAR